MSKVLTIAIEKGGSGKTTTAVNLAVLFAAKKTKVLFIDVDKQGNGTSTLTGKRIKEFSGTGVYSAIEAYGIKSVKEFIKKSEYENLDVLPASPELSSIEDLLKRIQDEKFIAPYEVLKLLIEPLHKYYDLIIFDSPSSLFNMTKGALVAADEVIVPLKVDGYALQGALSIIAMVDTFKKRINTKINLLGILMIAVDKRTKNHIEMKKTLIEKNFPVLETEIRTSEDVNTSTVNDTPVVELSPNCAASKDYNRLLKEIYKKIF